MTKPKTHKHKRRLPRPAVIINKTITEVETCLDDPLQAATIFMNLLYPDRETFIQNRLPTRHRDPDPFQLATEHFINNEFQKLGQVLASSQPVTIDHTNFQNLINLFPYEEQPQEPLPNQTLQPISTKQLLEELTNMARRYRAPGFSCFTPQHLLYLASTSLPLLLSLTHLTNLILKGEGDRIPNSDLLKYTKLAALKKKDNGIRPIGVNETVLNLAARLALHQCHDAIRNSLHPLDFGFSVAGATEMMMIAWQFLKESDERFIVIKFDFVNAYNRAFRRKLFKLISKRYPELLPFLKFRYSDVKFKFATTLDQDTVDCTSGVCQGCPLSPAISKP